MPAQNLGEHKISHKACDCYKSKSSENFIKLIFFCKKTSKLINREKQYLIDFKVLGVFLFNMFKRRTCFPILITLHYVHGLC